MISLFRHTRWILSVASWVFFLLSTIFLWLDWQHFLHTPIIARKASVDYILPAGASVRVLAEDLHRLGILHRPLYLTLLAYMNGDAKRLRAGEYRFSGGILPAALLKQIAEGQVLWRQITFPEGLTFNQIMNTLESNPLIVHQLEGLPPLMVMVELGIPGINPEGLFFPDTYRYTAGMTDKAILLQAYHEMQNRLTKEWHERDIAAPYFDPYQALVVASIIEKEARLNEERAMISGVIVRRLAKKMPLQMDSTIIYGLGQLFKLPITKADLAIHSPYNTYIYAGLPPTPIAMPGLASIHAALHPMEGNSLYFVARHDGSGSHQFSSTYKQQQQAVARYEGMKKKPTGA